MRDYRILTATDYDSLGAGGKMKDSLINSCSLLSSQYTCLPRALISKFYQRKNFPHLHEHHAVPCSRRMYSVQVENFPVSILLRFILFLSVFACMCCFVCLFVFSCVRSSPTDGSAVEKFQLHILSHGLFLIPYCDAFSTGPLIVHFYIFYTYVNLFIVCRLGMKIPGGNLIKTIVSYNFV